MSYLNHTNETYHIVKSMLERVTELSEQDQSTLNDDDDYKNPDFLSGQKYALESLIDAMSGNLEDVRARYDLPA